MGRRAEGGELTVGIPALSWVMIFLNGERFINEAITSVVAQKGVDDWELVLVDDGSTDLSSAIARGWADSDPDRIRYVEHPGHQNRGMSASRNLGVAESRGATLGFLDCDDVLLPGTMHRAASYLAEHADADVVIGRVAQWFSWSGADRASRRDRVIGHPAEVPIGRTVQPTELFHRMYRDPWHWTVPAICGVVIRREALDRVGGFDRQFTGMFEDQVLYSKIGLGLRVVLDTRVYALYRFHEWSAVAIDGTAYHWNPWRKNPQRDRFLLWQLKYVEDVLGSDSEEARMLSQSIGRRERLVPGLRRLSLVPVNYLIANAPTPVATLLRKWRGDDDASFIPLDNWLDTDR